MIPFKYDWGLTRSSVDNFQPHLLVLRIYRWGSILRHSADFEAVAVVDVSSVKGLMVVSWSPSSADAFETVTAGGLTINLAGAGDFHRLNRAGVVTDLNGLSKQPEVKPQTTGGGLFVIHQGGSSQLFFSFSGFSDELIQRLNENAGVNLMADRGQFDDTTETLTANWVFVMLESN